MLSPYDHQILAVFRDGPKPFPQQFEEALPRLQREGYFIPHELRTEEYHGESEFDPGYVSHIPVTWRLTDKGRSALSEADEVRNQHAQDEKHKRTQDKLGIANVLISLFSFLAGLLVEYKTGLIDLFLSLFQ